MPYVLAFFALQLPVGIIAGTWIKRRAAEYFDALDGMSL